MPTATSPESATQTHPKSKSRPKSAKAYWTKQFYIWHWVSSAICLVAMILFAVTGITLNHAGQIKATPTVSELTVDLPPDLLDQIRFQDGEETEQKQPLPRELRLWIDQELDIAVGGKAYEWSDVDIYVDLPRPGGDAWMSIDRETGEIIYEKTTRGFIAYLNDLHKGRNTGAAWVLYMDIFSVACVVFCLTGLALLWVHARRRPSTWPIVAAGFLIPFLVIAIFVH
ncbi:PepSY-associated TM helix domain-containing protein [Pelagicoccus sp. SDUM812005]|uniref:PepSY-associated TM helix domain-containing protein n=1 Tax=Pelagicoccus sp. SDUM812005 TaxID=3041257 RepID=UPI00280DAF15|nr:PepSY-associated TM helix domain-containing protein [Pelagicoccus sp. SDUM812005]MDQ8179644.1 PepSY-associated TM helix domain-containing protein [Pelagicoccus sp. SDUM812005]